VKPVMQNSRRPLRLWLLRLLALAGRGGVVNRSLYAPPRRVLLIKPDHLGDVLLCTPALRLLRQQHPRAEIVALVGPWSVPILAHNPDIDTLMTLPFPGFARGAAARSVLAPYRLLLHQAMLLRAGHFDTALLLRDDHWWGAALALLAGIPRRLGYAVPECAPFLTRALPWVPEQHVSRQALALVQAMRGDPDPAMQEPGCYSLRYAPAPADAAWAATWLAQHGPAPDERLVVLHPGTGGAAKLWLPEHWAEVGNRLLDEAAQNGHLPLRLLLTGTQAEAALLAEIAQALHKPPLQLVGATNIGQLTALLGRAVLVLGVDSGPLHLAVSQGTPSLHLFGPSDARRFGPWGDPARHVVLQSGLWCSPCGVFHACPRHTDPPECMAHLEVAQVVQAAQRLLTVVR
jgi:heptosyltransferase-2/heptosyltransferase-3